MLVSKTYQVITEESAKNGDFAEDGFEFENQAMTLEEVIDIIEKEGFSEWSSYPPLIGDWISTVDPVHDRNYFDNGIEVYYSLHFQDISDEEFEALVNLGGI